MTKSFLDWIGRERETKRKEFWKRYEEHVLRTFLFFFLFETRSVKYRSGTNRTNPRPIFENQGFSISQKTCSIDWNFGKLNFLKNSRRLCRIHSTQIISWMKCMRMSLKVFQKHLFSTQYFKTRFSNFLPLSFQTLNIFCIKIIEYIILNGQTKFTYNFMY